MAVSWLSQWKPRIVSQGYKPAYLRHSDMGKKILLYRQEELVSSGCPWGPVTICECEHANLLLRSQTLFFETGSQWTRSSPIWLAWPNADQNLLGEERKGLGLQCSNHHPSLKVRASRQELKQKSRRRNTAYWTSCYLFPGFPRRGVSV